ncbi:hypothetical protein [Flavobacterium sp.]|uniref:hypothetical protein n=1 Tax=Flavobacterium sp. TaxID=239 RepID=UPI0011F554B2|nr:hypothetical protein [Flavobacterium sp.]RZJ72887.1 MAG: hypothetical protein EOO49_04435 [Flavobacterium sp.]
MIAEAHKIATSRWLAVIAVLTTFWVSKELWLANHVFPLIPAFSQILVFPDSISDIVFLAVSILIFTFGFVPKNYNFALIAISMLALVETDINRLQPTYYIFVLQLSEWAGYANKIMVYPENRIYNSLKDSLTQIMSQQDKRQTELHLYKP